MRESVSDIHIAGRYGGDEFIVFMPNTSAPEAYETVERLRRKLAERNIIVNNVKIPIRCSFGLTTMDLRPGNLQVSVETLMNQADQALYAAKKSGRNQVHMYTAENPSNT